MLGASGGVGGEVLAAIIGAELESLCRLPDEATNANYPLTTWHMGTPDEYNAIALWISAKLYKTKAFHTKSM